MEVSYLAAKLGRSTTRPSSTVARNAQQYPQKWQFVGLISVMRVSYTNCGILEEITRPQHCLACLRPDSPVQAN